MKDVAFQTVISSGAEVLVVTVSGHINDARYFALGEHIANVFSGHPGNHLVVDVRETTLGDGAFGPGLVANVMTRCRKHNANAKIAWVVTNDDAERLEMTRMDRMVSVFRDMRTALESVESWSQVPPEPKQSPAPRVVRVTCPQCGCSVI